MTREESNQLQEQIDRRFEATDSKFEGIEEKLDRLIRGQAEQKAELCAIKAIMAERCPMEAKRIDEIQKIVLGDPGNEVPGLVDRMRRVETWHKAAWIVLTVIGAGIGIILSSLSDRFFGKQ